MEFKKSTCQKNESEEILRKYFELIMKIQPIKIHRTVSHPSSNELGNHYSHPH